MEKNDFQQLQKRISRNVADIVFCIDASGSMSSCIEGVKNHIRSFVDGLQSDSNRKFDCRLGFLAQDQDQFDILDFTDDINRFSRALGKVSTRSDEFTLPALDWCMDFPWRNDAHRVIILFTDEPLDGGHKPGFQRQYLQELLQKAVNLRVMVYFVGPDCHEYRNWEKVPRSVFEPLEDDDFDAVDFQAVLGRIGKTVSASVGGQKGGGGYSNKDIYGIKGKININQL